MTEYEWGKDTARRPWWRLRPVGSPDWHVLNSIASVRPTLVASDNGKNVRRYRASYFYPNSTGNKSAGDAILNSVPQARKWCEIELAKFRESPKVRK